MRGKIYHYSIVFYICIYTSFNSLFKDSRHLKIPGKSLHTAKIERRMCDDVISHPRDCNKTDQTKEHCPWAMFPPWLWAATQEAFPSRAPCRVSERNKWELWKAREGSKTWKCCLCCHRAEPQLRMERWQQHRINQLWVEYYHTQGTPPPHASLGCYYNSSQIIKYFSALYWLHWDNTTFKAPVPQGRC